MTGSDVQNAVFEKAGMRGYRADQVDSFLHKVATFIDDQNEQIEDLTYKLKVLAEKVEEYRNDEENIREALLGAQKLGSSVLNEAKAKAKAITEEAQANADEMLAQANAKVEALTKESLQRVTAELNALKREYDAYQRSYDLLKKEVSKFKTNVMQQYRSHIAMVMSLPSVEEVKEEAAEEPAAEPIEAVNTAVAAEPEEKEEAEAVAAEVIEEVKPESEPAKKAEEPAEEAAVENVAEPQADVSPTIEFKRENAPDGKRPRPNYMEKFGELRFGGFNDK